MVDTLGLPLGLWVYPADVADREVAWDILPLAKAKVPTLALVWADGGYTGELEETSQEEIGCRVEIVRRTARQKGFKVPPRRWIVERSFGWLTRYRRLSKDFEYWADNSESMAKVAFIHLMVRRLARC